MKTIAAVIASLTAATLMAASAWAAPGVGGKPSKSAAIDGMQVFSAGAEIGRLLSLYMSDTQAGFGIAWVVSPQGFLFGLELSNAEIRQPDRLYFAGSGCSGQAYVRPYYWQLAQGRVYGAPEYMSPVTAYYISRGSAYAWISYASYAEGTNCVDELGQFVGPNAYPNDPQVTGVSAGSIVWPVTFGAP